MAESGNYDFDGVDDCLKVKVDRWFGRSSFECCPWAKFSRPGPWNLSKWKLCETVDTGLPEPNKLDQVMPVEKLDKGRITNPPTDEVQVTWIGHATMLVQFEGISVLTDPVFGEFCGPSIIPNGMNYKRYRKASCQVEDIPERLLDAVIISHNHYDHLEAKSVTDISHRFPDVQWFVASGQKGWMKSKGIPSSNVTELEWWQYNTLKVKDKVFKFICTPTQHWCQRGPHDFNKALWCGWVVKGPNKSFYFGGDTGYYEKLFTTIGRKYGPFDLAGIPVGAYQPRFITEFQHVEPAESVKIHRDIKSKQSIGIHWGTFELTNEFFVEPPQKVEQEMRKLHIDPSKFFCINIGETWSTGDGYKEREFMKYSEVEAETAEEAYEKKEL